MKKLINSLISPNSGKSHRRAESLGAFVVLFIMVILYACKLPISNELAYIFAALALGQSYLSTKK